MGKSFHLKKESDFQSKQGVKLWSLTFDLPGEKVNKFSREVIADFEKSLRELESKSSEIDVLVFVSGKKENFIAGADIKLIQETRSAHEAETLAAQGQELLNQWEDLPFPTVAAVNATALGGGCELSLSCSAIVISNSESTRIGLPEVQLGVIPGMGGCVRLPTKVGIANALDIILAGKSVKGDKAYRMGLADALLPSENFNTSAMQWAAKNFKKLKSRKRLGKKPKLGGMGGLLGWFLEKTFLGRWLLFSQARKTVLSKTKGQYPAPLEAIRVIRSTGTGYGKRLRGRRRKKAMAIEAKGFGVAAATPVSKNLIKLFFLIEGVKKATGLPGNREVELPSIDYAAVLGAGVMGGGIAQLFAAKDFSTRMKDITVDALQLGVEAAARIFKKQVKRRRLTQRQMNQKMNLISPTLDFSGFQRVGMIVEAVVENLDIKKKVFSELEDHISKDCIVASNTSSLSVSEMQKAFKYPGRFCGMHFFNPVHRMPLVEVIRGEKSEDVAVAFTYDFAKKLGKYPIVVKDSPGFLVNRLLIPYLMEATHMLGEGVPIDEIDQALVDFGMPMGPIELIDEVGVDVAVKVGKIFHEAFGDRMTLPEMTQRLVDEKRWGKKTKIGLYRYQGSERLKKTLDPKVYQILGVKPKRGILSKEEIVDRCVLTMISEAAMCLKEGVVATPSEVDLGMIMGTGFPPFRGGLLAYADHRGTQEVVARLKELEQRVGHFRLAPSEAMVEMGRSGKKFHKP